MDLTGSVCQGMAYGFTRKPVTLVPGCGAPMQCSHRGG